MFSKLNTGDLVLLALDCGIEHSTMDVYLFWRNEEDPANAAMEELMKRKPSAEDLCELSIGGNGLEVRMWAFRALIKHPDLSIDHIRYVFDEAQKFTDDGDIMDIVADAFITHNNISIYDVRKVNSWFQGYANQSTMGDFAKKLAQKFLGHPKKSVYDVITIFDNYMHCVGKSRKEVTTELFANRDDMSVATYMHIYYNVDTGDDKTAQMMLESEYVRHFCEETFGAGLRFFDHDELTQKGIQNLSK